MGRARDIAHQTGASRSDPDPSRGCIGQECFATYCDANRGFPVADTCRGPRCACWGPCKERLPQSSALNASNCTETWPLRHGVKRAPHNCMQVRNKQQGQGVSHQSFCCATSDERPSWRGSCEGRTRPSNLPRSRWERERRGCTNADGPLSLGMGTGGSGGALSIAGVVVTEPSLPVLDRGMVTATGAFLLVFAGLLLAVCLYTMVISKFDGSSAPAREGGHAETQVEGGTAYETVRDDYYYCLLAPLSLVTLFPFVHWNWLSMKFYRHA